MGHQRLLYARIQDAKEKQLVRNSLRLVLSNQYTSWSDCVNHVTAGSGMGQIHSGTVADLAFWSLVESSVQSVKDRFRLFCWARFRDDLFVITEGTEGPSGIFEWACEAALQHWKLELESSSQYCAGMLDVLFYKCPHFKKLNRLDNAPHIKASARNVPLRSNSAHHPRIHRSWPVAETQRISKVSMHHSSFEYYRMSFEYQRRRKISSFGRNS